MDDRKKNYTCILHKQTQAFLTEETEYIYLKKKKPINEIGFVTCNAAIMKYIKNTTSHNSSIYFLP